MKMIKILIAIIFTIFSHGTIAQTPWGFSDFHIDSTAEDFFLRHREVNCKYLEIDTTNYVVYNLQTISTCDLGISNTITYRKVNPTSNSGDSASNINIRYSAFYPAIKYYISDTSGQYYNGYDEKWYTQCQSGYVPVINRDFNYSKPELIIDYPIYYGKTFTDSAYFTSIENLNGCSNPFAIDSFSTSISKVLILGKVKGIGKLNTPCANYDSVYFIVRNIYTSQEKTVYKSGMLNDSTYIDTNYIERYNVKITNTIGLARNHNYILFEEKVTETQKYYPDSIYTSDTLATLHFKDFMTSKNEINRAAEITVYPNPSTDRINIITNYSLRQISLSNSIGQIIEPTLIKRQGSVELNLRDLKAGIYTLRLETDNETVYKKIVKQ